MSDPVWGLLAKGVADPEKIEEAIARMIADHENDPGAHLGTEGSLQSHKASEIIDHLAESIVNDKIAKREISQDQLIDFAGDVIDISFETLDVFEDPIGAYLFPFCLFLHAGPTINSWGNAVSGQAEGYGFDRSFIWQTRFVLDDSANTYASIAFGADPGDVISQGCGFEFDAGTLKVFHMSGPIEEPVVYRQTINGISGDVFHTYRVKHVYNEKIEFFIDDVLVHTVVSNLPDPTWGLSNVGHFIIKNLVASTKGVYIRQCRYVSNDYIS